MYVSLWNQPSNLFGQFELLRRELDEAFGASGLPSSIRSVTPGSGQLLPHGLVAG